MNIPYSVKTNKTGQKVKEHHEGDVQDPVFKAVLSQAYEMFRVSIKNYVYLLQMQMALGIYFCNWPYCSFSVT